jgi:hypothetical protein
MDFDFNSSAMYQMLMKTSSHAWLVIQRLVAQGTDATLISAVQNDTDYGGCHVAVETFLTGAAVVVNQLHKACR